MRASMTAILSQAGRKFNGDEVDGVSRRHILSKRAIRWVFVLAVVIVALAGLRSEAAAQVFQGPLQFNQNPSFVFTMTPLVMSRR